MSDVVSRGILSKFQQDGSQENAGSVFDMTEAKIPMGSPDKIYDVEDLNELDGSPGSPNRALVKTKGMSKEDDKIMNPGIRSDPSEILEEGFVDIARL